MSEIIDYVRYRTYDQLTELLMKLEERYPQLLTITSIGKSLEGRDIWVAEVTDQGTGLSGSKPASYFDANIHAGEVTGSAVALYLIGYLCEQYGTDDKITALLDTRALYVVPRVSVDGADIFLQSPQTLRSSTKVRPQFESEGGVWPEDINGDGLILDMRVRSESGGWKVSDQDQRLMIPRCPGDIQGEFYHVLTEGRVKNERLFEPVMARSQWPLDLNRTFPADWSPEVASSGDYPVQEPEARALAEFILAHPNISCAVAYHTAAGIIMRCPFDCYDREMNSADFAVVDRLARVGTEVTGYPAISGYLGWSSEFPMNAQGTFSQWAYDHRGMISYTIELWDMAATAGITIDKNYGAWWTNISEQDMISFLQWNDRELDGQGFVDWERFDHPQLGSVEIGGWINKYTRQNPPLKYLQELMHKNTLFAVELAAASPRVVITEANVERLSARVSRVVVRLNNVGYLPTNVTRRAIDIHCVDDVQVCLNGEVKLAAGEQTTTVGHLDGYGPGRNGWGYLFKDRSPRSSCCLEWVVTKNSDQPVKVIIKVDAGRGGCTEETIVV